MEELLNKLIEKGWRPFGIKSDNICFYCLKGNKIVISYYDFDTEWECNHEDKRCSYRELVSMESWLRQFVCQNNMVDKKKIWIFYEMFLEENWIDAKNYRPFSLVERLIIESALCDEDKLEDFLLSNIKVS